VTGAFVTLTGVSCPDGCGECCTHSRVEAVTVEMMPLALDLWQKGEADFWLERIPGSRENPACVFYKPDPANPLRGRCMVYEMRPLVCRPFGFFMTRSGHGQFVYSGCRVIGQKDPQMHRNAVETLSTAESPSLYSDYGIRILGLDSGSGKTMLPVNKAALTAILKIGYRFDLSKIAG
jgi:Fe-S-cluster containining protein